MQTYTGHLYQVTTLLTFGLHGSVVPSSLGIAPTLGPGVLIPRAHKTEVSYTWLRDGSAVQQWKMRTHEAMGWGWAATSV